MPLRFCLVFFAILFNFFSHFNPLQAQKVAQISMIVNSLQAVPDGQNIFMVGNMGAYNPFLQDTIEFTKTAEGVWIFVMKFPEGALIEFNFTRSKDGAIEVGMDKQPIGKRSFIAQGNQMLKFTVDRWDDLTYSPSKVYVAPVIAEYEAPPPPPKPDIPPPRLFSHRQLKGHNLSPRDIYVWLPPDYHLEKTKRYPVLYVHQPHGIFNPNTTPENDWQVDETVDDFFDKGYMQGWIVVLIHNANDRSFNTDDYHVVKPYIRFVANKVKPFIDVEYRTQPDPYNTMTLGHGMAASVSFALAARYPDVFGKAACLSPYLYFQDDYKHLAFDMETGGKSQAMFYFDCGSTPAEARRKDGIDRLISKLRQQGFIVDSSTYYDPYEETFWPRRIEKALQGLL